MGAPRKGLLNIDIDGVTVPAPIGWQEVSVLATWDSGNTQANITVSELELPLSASEAVRKYIADGLAGGTGIFEGLPVKLEAGNVNGTQTVFDGYINLTNGFKDDPSRSRCFVSLDKKDGLNSLNDRLEGLTYGYLESIGVYGAGDYVTVDYVVEKPDNALEIILTAITLYMMTKELAEATRATNEAIIDVAALFSAGVTGGLAATIKTVGQAAILLAYNAIILYAVVNLANNLFAALISPVRKHKGMKIGKFLSKVCTHLGYGFETDIPELEQWVFIPSNLEIDKFGNNGFINVPAGTKKGIPNSGDGGYGCAEMFTLLMNVFNARYSVIDGTVQFRTVNSDYWIRRADYYLPPVSGLQTGYNTDELYANRLTSFQTDPSDSYTLENYKGTVCEAITDAIYVRNPDAKYLKGLYKVNIPWALGNHKTKLNALENALSKLGGVIDGLTGVFGGGTNFAKAIKSRVGMLKVSSNNTSLPKLLYLDSKGRMPSDHRDRLSASYIEKTYGYSRSFLADSFRAQKLVFTGVQIPFGFDDMLKVMNNNACYDQDGREALITKLEYNISDDRATVDYEVRQPYTFNLQETLIEP